MEEGRTPKGRRAGIVINYLCLAIIVILFYIGEFFEYRTWIIISQLVALVLGILTFLLVYIKTGLWKLVHSKIEKLDEREVHLVDKGLRYAYAIMSVTLLIIIYVTSFMKTSVGMVPAICLVYLAHILPASAIAWMGKQV
ncbi:hypothetical protein JXI42_06240 [bacterium]|nr:hypothetical protein [bacterium]